MSKFDIIRAWKDEEYRNSLSEEELSQLPENPAGEIELSAGELAQVGGANGTYGVFTAGCCDTVYAMTCGLVCQVGSALVCPTVNCPTVSLFYCF